MEVPEARLALIILVRGTIGGNKAVLAAANVQRTFVTVGVYVVTTVARSAVLSSVDSTRRGLNSYSVCALADVDSTRIVCRQMEEF